MLPAHLIEKYPDACRMAPTYQPLYTTEQTQEQRNEALEKGLAVLGVNRIGRIDKYKHYLQKKKRSIVSFTYVEREKARLFLQTTALSRGRVGEITRREGNKKCQ